MAVKPVSFTYDLFLDFIESDDNNRVGLDAWFGYFILVWRLASS